MLILAGISLSGLIGGKGLFQRTEDASNIYNEKKAREVLETVLLTDGQFEKNTNPEYNEEEFLNKLIKDEIPGSDVRGDVAIIGGEYAYDLDRSVPKIGIRGNNGYLGNPKDLVWPEVVIVSEPTLIENGRKSKFKIRATIDEKATKGITRIELWLNGKKLNQDREYTNEQREVEEEYIVNRNGVYTIKAYAELMGSNKTTVEGIVPAVEFSPNGSKEWKKEHSTKVTVKETEVTVTEMKYVWTNSQDEPAESTFTETCTNNSIITGKGFTGEYYLWVWFKTSENKTNICGSKGFYFDNEGPTVTSFTAEKYSIDGITIKVSAQDLKSKIKKFEVYVDDKLKWTEYCETPESYITKDKEINGLKTGKHNCKVVIYDVLNNVDEKEILGITKVYWWSKWETIRNGNYEVYNTGEEGKIASVNGYLTCYRANLNQETGYFESGVARKT